MRISDWSSDVCSSDLIRSLAWIAGGLVLLMTAASGAVVIMTARAALGTHFATIEMLHLIGPTDRQITRLFQRRIAIDPASGLALRSVVAAATPLLTGWPSPGGPAGLPPTAPPDPPPRGPLPPPPPL